METAAAAAGGVAVAPRGRRAGWRDAVTTVAVAVRDGRPREGDWSRRRPDEDDLELNTKPPSWSQFLTDGRRVQNVFAWEIDRIRLNPVDTARECHV